MQATDQDARRSARADTKATAKKPSFFKMRAQLLDQGRTNTALARTDNMWATLKVYASGGENGLHTHPHEDHTFIVLQGSARYYDRLNIRGEPMPGDSKENKRVPVVVREGEFFE